MTKYLRLTIVFALVLGAALFAKDRVVWASLGSDTEPTNALNQDVSSMPLAKPGPGSVRPPAQKGYFCVNGQYSVGGVVTIGIKDLKPGYCIEAELWNPIFQSQRIPEDAGKILVGALSVKIYYNSSLVYEVLPEDGSVDACYAIPPKKQAKIYFYDFYGKRFEKRTEIPNKWDLVDTRINENNTVACVFTQKSGLYDLAVK
jgi:hypothetical protein